MLIQTGTPAVEAEDNLETGRVLRLDSPTVQ
jgi:hypothetical protein